jgi:hypothetical protein
MGLDMYLHRKCYLSGIDEEKPEITIKSKKLSKEQTERVSDIHFEEIYWRKANHIHNWFVNNVQAGIDDCGEYIVSRAKLEKLRDVCKQVIDEVELKEGKILSYEIFTDGKRKKVFEKGKVIKNPEICEELLPCTSGFFFGGTDYDEYYYNETKRTHDKLERILNEEEIGDYGDNFYYHSSW